MEELNTIEIDEISGGGIIRIIASATRSMATGIYNSGMNAYYSGAGDTYLLALQGGNLGA